MPSEFATTKFVRPILIQDADHQFFLRLLLARIGLPAFFLVPWLRTCQARRCMLRPFRDPCSCCLRRPRIRVYASINHVWIRLTATPTAKHQQNHRCSAHSRTTRQDENLSMDRPIARHERTRSITFLSRGLGCESVFAISMIRLSRRIAF